MVCSFQILRFDFWFVIVAVAIRTPPCPIFGLGGGRLIMHTERRSLREGKLVTGSRHTRDYAQTTVLSHPLALIPRPNVQTQSQKGIDFGFPRWDHLQTLRWAGFELPQRPIEMFTLAS